MRASGGHDLDDQNLAAKILQIVQAAIVRRRQSKARRAPIAQLAGAEAKVVTNRKNEVNLRIF